jgi:hypothetical protein
MRAQEFIGEIFYASGIPSAQWTTDILNAANEVGHIDGRPIYAFRDTNHIFIFVKENSSVPAYIVISTEKDNGEHTLNRASNTGQKGLVSMLVAFAISEVGPLKINSAELLTNNGLKWIKSIATSLRFRLTDHRGNTLSVNELDQEWIASQHSGNAGPTEIIIDVGNGIKTRIAEHKQYIMKNSLFQPAYIFMETE